MSKPSLTPAERTRLEQLLRRTCGLTLAQGLQGTLDAAVRIAAADAGVAPKALLQRALDGEARALRALVERALVHESYFFRQPRHFEALRRRVLDVLPPDEEARLWSAGCAFGEEPYSLAISAALSGARARIVASDLSEAALRRARDARYSAWALRGLAPALRDRFFESGEAPARVVASIRGAVRWAAHNLISDPPALRDCHAIFCRNVLIYFDEARAREVLRGLVAALRPGGLLVLGTAESPLASDLGLTWVEDDALFVKAPADAPARAPAPIRAALPTSIPPRPTAPSPRPPAREEPRVPSSNGGPQTLFAQALAAARCGLSLEAERLALDSAEREGSPESFLLLAMVAEERGELSAALDAARRAIRIDPALAMGHATLANLLRRSGATAAAERALGDALQVLNGLDPATPLRSVEPITAGALRLALEQLSGPTTIRGTEDAW